MKFMYIYDKITILKILKTQKTIAKVTYSKVTLVIAILILFAISSSEISLFLDKV